MSNSKRRRYTRYEINLAATIVTDDASFIQCVIRDFCSGGMFIELEQGRGVHNLTQHQKIKVQFVMDINNGNENFSLTVQVMHIKSIGIGVAFEGGSEKAFNALKKEVQKNLGLEESDGEHNPTNSKKKEKLEADLTLLMKEALPQIIEGFFQKVKRKLAETTEQGGHYQYQVILLDVRTNLKINKDVVFGHFCGVTNQDAALLGASPFDQIDETQAESNLSLVEKNDFEDWLNLSTIIRNLDTLFETELQALQEKMAFVLEVDKNRLFNPLCPAKLCDRFRDTITEIESNDQTKRCLYIIFEEVLNAYLPELYEKLGVVLYQHGATENKGVTPRSFKKITPGARPIEDHHPSQDDEELIQQIIETSTDSESENHAEIEVIPSVLQQNSPSENRQIVSVASNLIELLQEQKTPKQLQSPVATMVENSSDIYSSEEISAALGYLQQHTIQAETYQLNTPNNLQKELQHALINFSSLQKRLSSTDKKSLDMYESLFEILLNDQMVTHESQSYLKRIQIPIMAQAMQDNSFIESENDPARNIVNHLFWLGSAIKDDKTAKSLQIRQVLDNLMEKISIEGLNNPTIFSAVEQKLGEATQSVNKSISHNIKRVTDIYEGKQKLEKARQFVQDEINHHFLKKQIPNIIISLLDAGWQHLLVIDKLHEDKNAFQNHLGIVNSLYHWLAKDKKPRVEVAENVLEFIASQLQLVCTNTFLHSKIVLELNSLLLTDDIDSNSDAMELATFLGDKETRATQKTKQRLDEVDFLKVGEWLMVLLGKEFEPLKLAWISDVQEIFVFVNRAGLKKLELNRDALADLIRNGAANKIESLDMPIMDRATNMMLQNLQHKLVYNATRDPVTNVYNRKEFLKQLKIKLTNLENAKYLLCNIEVQDYRIITNACGLTGSDALLKQIANILKNLLKKDDIFARLDDKTFTILLKNCSAEVAKKLQTELVSGEFNWEDKSYAIAVSMGIVPLFSEHSYDINSLLQQADSATLSAIEAGRNRIRVYNDDDESLKSQYNANEWVGRINQVFAEKRLFLRCQKIAAINPEKGSHTHYEILLGIKDEKGNTIAPDDFIPAVERCQRMSEVDQWVVLNVFDWIENNQAIFKTLDGFSINLSGESMNSEGFLEFLKKTLTSCSVPLEKITFEITETVAAGSFEFIQSFIKQIKRFKCKFSLDDFGSGYSSYSYLKSLDVDYLKIDGIFVKDIVNNSTDVAIVKSMNEIGHSLNMKTIAEYVENEEIFELLKEMNVDYAQGWGVQKPILITDLS